MKTMFLIPVLVIACITGQSQTSAGTNNSGKIRYEEKSKLEIKLEGQSAQYADMLPKERTEQTILYFSPDASLYQRDREKQKNEVVEQEAAGAMVHFQVYQSDDKVYRDLKENKKLEQREFMTRMFLIESDAGMADWKLTSEQKVILNYPCQEALREDDGKKIRAWFTPAIPVSSGPQNFGNLPGMILSVDIDNGDRTITASSVELSPVNQDLLVKPKEGKKVTAEQYQKIVDKKLKESGAEVGSGQHTIIKIQM
jgi:GLPGLI family protein